MKEMKIEPQFITNFKSFKKSKTSDKVFYIILLLIMFTVLYVTLFPFINVLAISFNKSSDTTKGGIGLWPRVFTIDNYKQLSRYPAIFVGFYISVLRTVLGTISGVFCTSVLAYCISRRDFVLRKFITTMFVLTMYISGGLIPGFMVIRMLGLNNSFWVYIIPSFISAYNLIIMRSFIDEIPYSLQESAFIDGANDFQIFVKIVLPLCKPVIATIALFIAVGQWTAWFDTYLFAPNNESITTLQYELMKILQGSVSSGATGGKAAREQISKVVSPLSIRMAITVVTVVPVVIIYPFVQKFFVSGMTLGAVKS